MHRRYWLALSAAVFATAAMPVRAVEMPDVPEAIAVPNGKVLLAVAATGTQIYECARMPKGELAWSFREPKADLMQDGKAIGRHFAGPTWEFSDGSRVKAQPAGKAPGKTAQDIPWLKLAVTDRAKKGPAAGARFVLRIATEGGSLSGPCPTDKSTQAVPYKATYVFVK